MTPQEALKIRKNPHFEDVDNEELSRCIDEALEKQIPKKPKSVADPMFGDLTLTCPRCGNVNLANPFKHNGYDYCPDCGQALDFGDDY